MNSTQSKLNQTAFKSPLLKNISPEGWFKQQLIVQKEGLTGHIEDIWGDLGPSSGWLGGVEKAGSVGPIILTA